MASIVVLETTRTGILSERSLAIDSAGVNPAPPAMTRSAAEADDLLDIDRPEGHDVGQRLRVGREVARVVGGDDPAAGTDREQGLGDGRGQGHDLLGFGRERDGGALVVGERGTGNAGAGADSGSGRRSAAAGSRWRRDRSRRLGGRCRGRRSSRRARQRGRRRRRQQATRAGVGAWRRTGGDGGTRSGTSEGWVGRRGRDESRNPSLRIDRRRGLAGEIARSCLPFSRRFEHAPCGRRPDLRSRRGVHRSGTVPGSHRLRDHAG